MPVPPIIIPQQVQPVAGNLPFVQQMDFGQMIGFVSAFNPNSLAQIPGWINTIARKIYDLKTWYGLMVKGQVICPQAVSGGTATVTMGSTTIQGNGTTWDNTLIGRQFRVGLNNPIYTIVQVNQAAQQLTIELPWGGPLPPGQTTQTSGYNIVQMYYSLGPNIKYVKRMVNVMLGYRMRLDLTQGWLDNRDPWRIWTNFPYGIAPLPTDPLGNYLVEMWPAPFTNQAMPFFAYCQPANLINDGDSLPPYIRCDIVCKEAIAWALEYKPKDNPGYSEQSALTLAARKHQEFLVDIEAMWNSDENLWRTSSSIVGEDWPEGPPGGALYAAQHACMANDSGYDYGW